MQYPLCDIIFSFTHIWAERFSLAVYFLSKLFSAPFKQLWHWLNFDWPWLPASQRPPPFSSSLPSTSEVKVTRFCLFEKKTRSRRMDGSTDGWTDPLIVMHGHIKKLLKMEKPNFFTQFWRNDKKLKDLEHIINEIKSRNKPGGFLPIFTIFPVLMIAPSLRLSFSCLYHPLQNLPYCVF